MEKPDKNMERGYEANQRLAIRGGLTEGGRNGEHYTSQKRKQRNLMRSVERWKSRKHYRD